MKRATYTLAALLAAFFGHGVAAEEFEVRMLNRGEKGAMVFEPELVRAQVGDTVRFVAVDKGHNAETIDGMIPDGVEKMAGAINEEVAITLDKEGVYGIRCKPHVGLGMVALVVAGEPVNMDAAKDAKTPRKAHEKFEELFAELGAD